MSKFVHFTSFTFIMLVLFFASNALAQVTGVRSDYDRYARLFHAKREPDFATDTTWRGAYGRNNWAGNADGSEFRAPLPEAQVLTGLYMLATVERKLNSQIQNLVLEKALLSKTLSEIIVLDQIASEIGEDLDLVPDGELTGDYRGVQAGIKMERLIRQRITSAVPNKLRVETRSLQNKFLPEIAGGQFAKYRAIREQITVLDVLADSFAFNWDAKKKEEELERMKDNSSVQKMAAERVRLDSGMSLDNLTVEEVEEMKERKLLETAKEEFDKMVAKHTAFKYLIGVYQGMDYHVRDLEKIYHYYLDAANQGNPIAQYHITLFLYHFGDILNLTKEDVDEKCREWLEKAYHSEVTREHVAKLRTQLAMDSEKIAKRKEETGKKIEELITMEHDRITMVENVLLQSAKRIRRINELQKKAIEEMERERERMAMIEVERIRAAAIMAAAALENMQPQVQLERIRAERVLERERILIQQQRGPLANPR